MRYFIICIVSYWPDLFIEFFYQFQKHFIFIVIDAALFYLIYFNIDFSINFFDLRVIQLLSTSHSLFSIACVQVRIGR